MTWVIRQVAVALIFCFALSVGASAAWFPVPVHVPSPDRDLAGFLLYSANASAGGGAVCSAAVTTAGLQSVCNLEIAGATGARASVCTGGWTLVTGLSTGTLPGTSHTIWDGTFVTTNGNDTVSCFDFGNIPGIVIIKGNATVATYSDNKFSPSTASTSQNAAQCDDPGSNTHPTCNFNFNTINGLKCQSQTGCWGGSALSCGDINVTGTVCNYDHNLITGIPGDVFKCTNATAAWTNNYVQGYGWVNSADADAPQGVSCVGSVNGDFRDITDIGILAATPDAVFTGKIDNGSGSAGTTLTVTGITSGTICINGSSTSCGGPLSIAIPGNINIQTTVTNQLTGTTGGVGTYATSSFVGTPQLVTSQTITQYSFPGDPPNSFYFDTIDTGSLQNSSTTIKNTIVKGWNLFPVVYGTPFNSLLLCEGGNHPTTGGPYTQTYDIENNVISIGQQGYAVLGANHPSNPSTGTVCPSPAATWTGNLDYDAGTTIAAP